MTGDFVPLWLIKVCLLALVLIYLCTSASTAAPTPADLECVFLLHLRVIVPNKCLV